MKKKKDRRKWEIEEILWQAKIDQRERKEPKIVGNQYGKTITYLYEEITPKPILWLIYINKAL